MSRTFKMSVGANLKLLKKIDKKLQKIIDQDSNHQTIWLGLEDGGGPEIDNERYKLAVELQESIKQWKRDIGYEEGLKEINKFDQNAILKVVELCASLIEKESGSAPTSVFAKKIINSLIPELSFETYSKVSDYMEIKTNVNHEDHIIRFGANARRKTKNEDSDS